MVHTHTYTLWQVHVTLCSASCSVCSYFFLLFFPLHIIPYYAVVWIIKCADLCVRVCKPVCVRERVYRPVCAWVCRPVCVFECAGLCVCVSESVQVCLCVCMSVQACLCVSVRPVCVSVCMSVQVSVCMCVWMCRPVCEGEGQLLLLLWIEYFWTWWAIPGLDLSCILVSCYLIWEIIVRKILRDYRISTHKDEHIRPHPWCHGHRKWKPPPLHRYFSFFSSIPTCPP